jgi:hypothetical protein
MTIQAADIQAMIAHWLSTPVNGYFGSGYGADLASLLLRPLSAPIADEFLDKLRRDVPIVAQLDSNQLSLQSETVGFERKIIYLQIGRALINLNKVSEQIAAGETFDVDAG